MFNGLFLELKYLAFKFDKFYDKYIMLSTKTSLLSFGWIMACFADGFSFVIFRIIFALFSLLLLLIYLFIYFYFVVIAFLLIALLMYIDSSIGKELIAIITATIGLTGIIGASMQNRKQFIDEQRANAYQELTKVFIDATRGFTEKLPLEIDLALEKYISLSSNKVLSLIVEIKEKSKKLSVNSTNKEIKDIIDYSLFLINFMRYEININRDTALGSNKYSYYSLRQLICYDYFENQTKLHSEKIVAIKDLREEKKLAKKQEKLNRKEQKKIDKVVKTSELRKEAVESMNDLAIDQKENDNR